MSPHRLFRSPTAGAALLRSSRPLLHHRRHRFGLCVARLEDRTLLSSPSGDVLAAVAPKIELGTPKNGTLAPGEVAFFQIDPTTDGRLVAQVHAEGATTRLSLWDAQGQVLMQSDGQSPSNPDDQIDLHVPAGTDYLEVENLGGAGAYTLTTSLMPSPSPFQPIPHSAGTAPSALVAGDFTGDGRTDLAVANDGTIDVSVLLGNGDGTFQHQVLYAVGFEPDDLVAGDLTGDGHTDLAVANYTLSLSLHPRSPRVLRRRGWSYLADDANRPAAHDFDEALQFAPKDADAFSGRGLARARLGRHEGTASDAEQSPQLGEKNWRIACNVARIYAQSAVALDTESRKTGPAAVRVVTRYLERSVNLERLALDLVPAEQRSVPMRETIMTDPTLHPIRRRLKSLERLKIRAAVTGASLVGPRLTVVFSSRRQS